MFRARSAMRSAVLWNPPSWAPAGGCDFSLSTNMQCSASQIPPTSGVFLVSALVTNPGLHATVGSNTGATVPCDLCCCCVNAEPEVAKLCVLQGQDFAVVCVDLTGELIGCDVRVWSAPVQVSHEQDVSPADVIRHHDRDRLPGARCCGRVWRIGVLQDAFVLHTEEPQH